MKTSSMNLTAEFAKIKQLRNHKTSRWQQLKRSLIAVWAGNSEPKIHRISECNWRIYDPASGQTLHFSTEQEVRIWLDQRYSF